MSRGGHSSSSGAHARRASPALRWNGARALVAVALLATVVYVAQHLGEEREFAKLARRARPEWLLVGIALQLATYPCASAVWHRVAARHDVAPRLRSLVPLGLVKLFVDQVAPTAGVGGTLLVARGLARRGIARPIATASMLVDLQSFYLGHGAALAFAVAILRHSRDREHVVVVVALAFAVAAVAVSAAIAWIQRRGPLAVPNRLRRSARLREIAAVVTEAPASVLRDRVLLLQASVLQLSIVVLDAATLAAALAAVCHDAAPLAVFAAFSLASAIASIGLVPGGVGLFEATSIGTLHVLGVPLEAGLAATLLARGLMLWLPLAPGFWLTRRELRAGGEASGASVR